MQKFEYIPTLTSNVNKSKSGGGKIALSDSSFAEVNPSTHTCGRLLARAVLKVAFVVSILFLSGACQKATLIPDEDSADTTRGADEEAPQDTTIVKPEFDINGWEGAIDADFTFGGKEQE